MDAVKNVNVRWMRTLPPSGKAELQPLALNSFSKRSFHVVIAGPTPHDDNHDFAHGSRETNCFAVTSLVFFQVKRSEQKLDFMHTGTPNGHQGAWTDIIIKFELIFALNRCNIVQQSRVFCFNLLSWGIYWLCIVMAVGEWLYIHLYWFPSLAFTSHAATGQGSVYGTKEACLPLCRIRFVFPGSYPQVTEWKLPCRRKTTQLMEEAEQAKSDGDRNGGKTRVNGQSFTRWRELRWCVQVCYPVNMCFPLLDRVSIKSTSNKTCLSNWEF